MSENGNKDYPSISYVLASGYRKEIIKTLADNFSTPKRIAEKMDKPISHVSNTLTELQEKNIVECKTPSKRKGKIYELTEKGKEIYEEIEEF